jgi:hypothetical protein
MVVGVCWTMREKAGQLERGRWVGCVRGMLLRMKVCVFTTLFIVTLTNLIDSRVECTFLVLSRFL